MFDFSSLNRVVFTTVHDLDALAREVQSQPGDKPPDLKGITETLHSANDALEETIQQSAVSDAAQKAIMGLRKDLRQEVLRTISRQILFLQNMPQLHVQAGSAQAQQTLFSRELKKFEERLQYVLKLLKKSRGGQTAEVEQDDTR